VITCYRLSSSRYSPNSGSGAAHYGSRWNPKGIEAIYAAASVSLAALEVLVHYSILPHNFVVTEIHIPPSVAVEVVPPKDLPADWNSLSPSSATQAFGKAWALSLRSAVLCLPSSIVPAERIYVLNPNHPKFGRIEFLTPVPFPFDTRLK
jgi:RES domain-containing protein